MIVWAEAIDNATSDLCRYTLREGQYVKEILQANVSATRVKAASNGDVLVIHEREGVSVIDGRTRRLKRRARITTPDEPMICSEAIHPELPLAVFGNHYGKVTVWDWERDKLLFEKWYFPRGEVQWINGLAVDSAADCILFAIENTLFRVRLADGGIVVREQLGPEEETSGFNLCEANGLFAVGGLMETKVYSQFLPPRLAYAVRNERPLVQTIRFSSDGALLAVLSGMSVGGNVAAVRDAETGTLLRAFSDLYPAANDSMNNLMGLSVRSISFSTDGRLVAVGEGGRIGVYRRE